LYPLAILRPLHQSVADLTMVDADIFQIPIAEMAQRDKVRLTLTVRDRSGDHAVDETAEARQKNGHGSPNCWDGVAWGGVSIVMAFSFRKGRRSRTTAKNALPNISADAAISAGDVPSNGIAAPTAVSPVNSAVTPPLWLRPSTPPHE
jgi:hypothetical protein